MTTLRNVLTLLGLTSTLMAQGARIGQEQEVLNRVDEQARQARIAITGDLGLPALPPVLATSPRDSLLYADRFPTGSGAMTSFAGEGETPVIVNGLIPAGAGGTGTAFPEVFRYQLPTNYDEFAPPVPLVVAYHGFGSSANSVATFTTLEEECEARGWIYMAPTGIDDQLFGSPISQQNTEAAIQFMIDGFDVDPDRIYMVGFSMGGGVAANFASRRRDPEGLMIAAVGMVSSTFDWTLSYNINGSGIQTWLENQYNFGGTPTAKPFNYQQASSIYFDELTYPPAVPLPIAASSMARNLADLPVYMTYDSGDTLTHIPPTNDALESFLIANGGSVTKTVVSGTVDPVTMLPATHSWEVLDEADLLDWFALHSVDRTPEEFQGLQDLGGTISWANTVQRRQNQFTPINANADVLGASITATDLENTLLLSLDVSEVGLDATYPLRVDTSCADIDGMRLELTGFTDMPSYLTDAVSGSLITLVDSDPNTNSLFVDVPPNSSMSFDVQRETEWTTKFWSDPNPVAPGATTTLTIDAPSSGTLAYMIVAVNEQLYTAKGVKLVASVLPPSILVTFPLGVDGDVSFPATIDNNPALAGLRFPVQIVVLDGSFVLQSVSNLWGFKIE